MQTTQTTETEEKKESYGLEDIIPQKTNCILADEVEVHLRAYTVRDAQWATLRFGGEIGITKMFVDKDINKIVELLYHMLEDEDKAKFQYEEKEGFDDDGKPVTITVTGPEKLLEHVRSLTDTASVLNSIMTCVGLSMPILDSFDNALETEEALKDLRKKKQTGGGSSTE